MTLQTQNLVMVGLGIAGDQPPNSIQPILVDGIHVRWLSKRDQGIPWYGYYLFRRPYREGNPVCVTECLQCVPLGTWPSTTMALPYGQITSDRNLVLTDDFPPQGVPELDLNGRSYLRFDLDPGESARHVEVLVGFRQDSGQPPEQTCIDFRTQAVNRGPNPRVDHNVTFTVVKDQTGSRPPETYVDEWGSPSGPISGLFCGIDLDVRVPAPATLIELTLTHSGEPATVEAFNSDGTSAGTKSMTSVPRHPQTLTLTGRAITQIRVRTLENETLLNEFCFGHSHNQITITALLGTTVVTQTTVAGSAGQVVAADLDSDAISAVNFSPGKAALVDLCFVPVSQEATTGWESVPGFQYPMALPVLHPDYPPARGAAVNLAAAQTMALARVLYGPAAAWVNSFPDLHAALLALVVGGPGSAPMANRSTAIQGVPVPPDPGVAPPTMPRQYPLDLVLLASLNPAVAQMLGLYWVDRQADPARAYDYLVVADNVGIGNLDPAKILAELSQNGFAHLDGWIVSNQRVAPATALTPPADARVYALPGPTVRIQGGGLSDKTNNAGLRWNVDGSAAPLSPGSSIAYHIWRDDLGDTDTPPPPGTYQLITTRGPVLIVPASLPSGQTPQRPQEWPLFPLDFIDRGLADGWYSYQVSGVDIFGRHTPNSGAGAWYQWTPPPDPRPWYYNDPPADSVVHPFAVRLRDTVAPPPPTGIEAYALDPLDRMVVRDAPFAAWWATLSPSEQISIIGLRVRWLWTEALNRQAPRAREFRIYYQSGTTNALLGRTTSVTATSAGSMSTVDTNITGYNLPNAYAGCWLRIGSKAFPIVGSFGVAGLQLLVRNIGPARDVSPLVNRPCSIGIPPDHHLFVDYSVPTNWQDRYYVVDYDEHVTVALDGAGRPLRVYEVFVPFAGDTVRTGLPLAATLAEPIVYAHVGISTADDRTYVPDAAKWAAGHWGGRQGREGRVGAPAAIYRVLRTQPAPPVPPPDAESVYATPADYHGHSFYTYRWAAVPHLKAHVFRALDDAVFKTDWSKRPRPNLTAGDLQYFPDETTDPRWNAAKRQQVATELNQLNTIAHNATGTSQALAYYRNLSNDGLRVLAGLEGNDAAFSQLTIQQLDPDDLANANRPGPDNPSTFPIDPSLRIYIDTLDGRSSNRHFYRCLYVDAVLNRSPRLCLSSPPVRLPKVVPPRPPVITKVLGSDRQITIKWASNREPDLAEYVVYRADSQNRARDLRLMALVHTEAVPAGDPLTRPAEIAWIDTGVLGLVTYFYRIAAVDTNGNASAPSASAAVRAHDEALPTPPMLTAAWVAVGGTQRAQLTWTSSDETLLQRQVGVSWVDLGQWRPPNTYQVRDPFSNATQTTQYRVWARRYTGAIACGAPVTLAHV